MEKENDTSNQQQDEEHDTALKMAQDYITLKRTLLTGADILQICRAYVALRARQAHEQWIGLHRIQRTMLKEKR